VSAVAGEAGAQRIDRRYLRGRPSGLGPGRKRLSKALRAFRFLAAAGGKPKVA